MFSIPFNNFVPPLNLVGNLAFRKFNGTGAGHRMDHECNDAKCLWQFVLKGLWSFRLGNFRKRHRGTMIIWIVLPKKLDVQAWPILEGNKRDYPRGASVIDFMCLFCIRSSSVWFYVHANPRSNHVIFESGKLQEFKVYAITNKYPGVGVQMFTNGDET